ncbi:MAG: ABC transporter substrate-binding protein [Solirubrobacteraceae bacterium]
MTDGRALRAASVATATACALLLAACGGDGATSTGTSAATRAAGATAPAPPPLPAPLAKRTAASLVLDFTPEAVHAGIYRALAEGAYSAEHVDLHVIVPSETQDPLTMVAAGKATFGLADGSDLAHLISEGVRVKAVMAVGQQPFGGLIARASEHLSSPAALVGRTVGTTGVPSDLAVLQTEVADAGANPAKVRVVDVGYDGAAELRAGKIAAFTGFWPADGVALAVSGEAVESFKLNDWGGPAYPGLVAFTTDAEIARNPALVRDFVAATARGYEETIREPRGSLSDLEAAAPEVDAKVAAVSLRAYLPLFTERGKVRFGVLQRGRIEALSRWMVARGLMGRAVPFSSYGTNRFVGGG